VTAIYGFAATFFRSNSFGIFLPTL